MKKRILTALLVTVLAFAFTACGGNDGEAKSAASSGSASVSEEPVEVTIFAAASLSGVMEELKALYEEEHPNVTIIINADSSGALMQQIQEGAPCDIFFSAAQKQMDELEGSEQVVEGTRQNVVNNQLVVITQPDSNTAVTGLSDIDKAASFALADGSVPVGKYTRQALINLGKLAEVDDPATYTTAQVSEALGGIEISEQGNVSKVLAAVEEGSCEVGTTYLSDTYGHEDSVKILETVSYEVTGNVIYPVAQIVNPDATDAQTEAAADFLAFITSDEAKEIYETHLFDTNVE